MSSEHSNTGEVATQLRAYGATLEQLTAEPIRPAGAPVASLDAHRSRRRWVLVGAAACVATLVAGLVLLGGDDEPSQGASSPGASGTTAAPAPGTFARIGQGERALEPLVGVGAVVEATVVGHLGPIAELNGFGGVDYPGRSEDAAAWTTPDGLPVLVLDDLAIVEVVGGSGAADAAAQRLQDAVAAGEGIEVLAPLGVFAAGERYQLWISGWNQPTDTVTFLTYLAFDGAGQPVPGLDLPGLDTATEALVAHTGDTVVASLAALAREFNAAFDGAPQGPLMDALFGPAGAVVTAPPTTGPTAPGAIVTAPPTTGDAASLAARIAPDWIGLEGAGWTLAERSESLLIVQPAIDDVLACDAYSQLAGLMDVPTVRDAYTGAAGELLSVTYVEMGRGSTADALVAGIAGLAGCPEPGGVLGAGVGTTGDALVRYDRPALTTSGWVVGGQVAVVVVAGPDGSDVGVLLALSRPPAGTDDTPIESTLDAVAGAAASALGVAAENTGGIEVSEGFEVEPTDEVFVLMVSNQSFEDDPVGLQISIDGQVVADDRYQVGSQHTVTTYVVRGLTPGSHELSVTSDTGVSFVSTVTAAEGRPRWAYLTYWYYPDDTEDQQGRYVAVSESDEPIAIG